MDVFRKKTRSNEVLSSVQFRVGLIVWVPGLNGREERICTGPDGQLLTCEEHRRRKAERAAHNRLFKSHSSYPRRRRYHFV
jgi:hypothetical protein